MSGPYPPGYQRPPEDNGWWGQQGQHDFPTVQYSGLAGQPGWGGQPSPPGPPPPPKRSTGRIIVAAVSVLVIVGGIATGIILVSQRHQATQAAQQTQTLTPAPLAPTIQNDTNDTGTPTTDEEDNPGVPNGSTSLTLTTGACVSAQVGDDEQYTATTKVTCGSAQSDLVLAQVTPDMTGCADHQYLRITAPSSAVYCFTLDLKQGDCVDDNYLKAPCSGAPFMVLETEAGPGNSNSCVTATGATHWVPVGRDPVEVGCLGPPTQG